jgi:phosphoribosyl 1,2-cyclic phosphate phosphodiesterase
MAREHREYQRNPASALLEVDNKRYLIDAGLMDIADRFPASTLDGIFLTHFHPDHVQGLFHLRWGIGKKIPVYCPTDNTGCADLFKHPGILNFQVLRKYETTKLGELLITPIPLIHSKPTLGYIFENKGHRIAYLLDTKDVPPKAVELLHDKHLTTLVIDTCEPPGVENRNHNNLDDTLSLHQRIGASKTIMTHISHNFDIWLNDNLDSLPSTIIPGYDGCICN